MRVCDPTSVRPGSRGFGRSSARRCERVGAVEYSDAVHTREPEPSRGEQPTPLGALGRVQPLARHEAPGEARHAGPGWREQPSVGLEPRADGPRTNHPKRRRVRRSAGRADGGEEGRHAEVVVSMGVGDPDRTQPTQCVRRGRRGEENAQLADGALARLRPVAGGLRLFSVGANCRVELLNEGRWLGVCSTRAATESSDGGQRGREKGREYARTERDSRVAPMGWPRPNANDPNGHVPRAPSRAWPPTQLHAIGGTSTQCYMGDLPFGVSPNQAPASRRIPPRS